MQRVTDHWMLIHIWDTSSPHDSGNTQQGEAEDRKSWGTGRIAVKVSSDNTWIYSWTHTSCGYLHKIKTFNTPAGRSKRQLTRFRSGLKTYRQLTATRKYRKSVFSSVWPLVGYLCYSGQHHTYLDVGNTTWAQWEGPRHKELNSKLVMSKFKEKQKAAAEDTGETKEFIETWAMVDKPGKRTLLPNRKLPSLLSRSLNKV